MPKPRNRRNFFSAPAADVLEHRTLLAGTTFSVGAGQTLTIDPSQTGDVSVDAAGGATVVVADGTALNSLVVNQVDAGNGGRVQTTLGHGATAGSVTINGGFADDRLTLRAGSEVSVVDFRGGEGADAVRIEPLAVVDSIDFAGGADADRLDILGIVTGVTTANLGTGDDLVIVRDSASLGGSLVGFGGAGNDRLSFLGADVAGVDFGFAAGNDVFFVQPGTTFDGEVELDFGGGDDRIWAARGGMAVTGNFTALLSAGNDVVRLEGFDVGGDQFVDLGADAGRRETVVFGRDVIGGSSTVRYAGAASITETASRTIGGTYNILGRGGAATLKLTQDSQVREGVVIENFGRLDATLRLDTDFGGVDITTGAFSDRVVFLGGSQIVGNVTAFTGNAQDRFEFAGGVTDVTGNVDVNLGWGFDTFRAADLFLDGDLLLNLGFSNRGTDRAFFKDTIILGDSDVAFSARAVVAETGAQDIRGDYTVRGRGGTLSFTADAKTVVLGEFGLVHYGRNSVVAPFTVRGNARFIGGDRIDSFNLSGASFGGVLDVSTDGATDFVSLQDAYVAGVASVLLGNANDTLDNLGLFLDGPSFFDGGAGFDDLFDPGNGVNVNFEGTGGY